MSGGLMESIVRRAVELGVPINAHLDLTYRCNERCVHCYLHHEGGGELTTVEIMGLLEQLAKAGTLFLMLSGGEIFLRPDALEIIAEARRLGFSVKLKTNGTLVTPKIADALKSLGVHGVDISIYAGDAEVHDSITRVPGSLKKSLDAIEYLQNAGVRVSIANVLMRENSSHVGAVREIAVKLGVGYTLDPTVTPMIDGNPSVVGHRADFVSIEKAFVEFDFSGRPGEDCQPPSEEVLDGLPCSAGHCLVYVNPRGLVYPCVQFPLEVGDLRRQSFDEIWKSSSALAKLRSVRFRDLPICSVCVHGAECTRCPGLAWMEGDLRGPSTADCEKAEARTGLAVAAIPARPASSDR